MKKTILSLVVIASLLTACKEGKKEKVALNQAQKVAVTVAELNNVDTSVSVLNWKGTKPGGAHDGTVALKSGALSLENGALKSGEFVIDMQTITNVDMKGSDGAASIEGHLKSADFFDVATYPTSTFIITNVAEVQGKLAVTGDLKIKDITKSVTIAATISTENGVTVFKSEIFTIDRTNFNVKYKSKSFFSLKELKDKFIDDLMEMSFVVKTKPTAKTKG
jgi:polyisoprenoid-binding protein YceI